MSDGGKGDKRRPEATLGAYANGYDAIKWGPEATEEAACGGPESETEGKDEAED